MGFYLWNTLLNVETYQGNFKLFKECISEELQFWCYIVVALTKFGGSTRKGQMACAPVPVTQWLWIWFSVCLCEITRCSTYCDLPIQHFLRFPKYQMSPITNLPGTALTIIHGPLTFLSLDVCLPWKSPSSSNRGDCVLVFQLCRIFAASFIPKKGG